MSSANLLSSANKDVVRRFTEYAWGRGDMAAADMVLAEDLVEHHPLPGQGTGREGHKQIITAFRAAFPDLKVMVEDLLAEEDRVALRWRAEGTHRGQFMGVPPTGKRVTLSGIEILRVVEGRIAERWAEDNGLSLMRQIGAIPG